PEGRRRTAPGKLASPPSGRRCASSAAARRGAGRVAAGSPLPPSPRGWAGPAGGAGAGGGGGGGRPRRPGGGPGKGRPRGPAAGRGGARLGLAPPETGAGEGVGIGHPARAAVPDQVAAPRAGIAEEPAGVEGRADGQLTERGRGDDRHVLPVVAPAAERRQ